MADYTIAAQIRPPQFADPLQSYAQMQQLQTNMLAAQRLQQNIASENQLRNLFRGGQFNLESPELAARIGAIDPDMAFKVLQAQRTAKLTQRQAETEERRQQESLANIAVRRQELILKHGDTFRQALGQVEAFPEDQRAAVYQELRSGLPPDLQRQFPARYTPEVVRRGMMTTDQLIAAAKEAQPKFQALGDVPAEYVPGQGVRVLPVLPPQSGIPVGRAGLPPEQAGVPSYPVPAGRLAQMNAAAQRYAPELVGAAPAPAAAPAAAAPSPFGAAPTSAMMQPMTGMDFAAQQRERKLVQERETTAARERGKADVVSEERRKGAAEVLNAINSANIEDLIQKSTSGSVQRTLAAVPGAFGVATSGMEKIGQLGTIQSQLITQILGGKLGGGISDADVKLIKEGVADIANPDIPANQRLAAFRQLKNNLEALAGGKEISVATPTRDNASRDAVDTSNKWLR